MTSSLLQRIRLLVCVKDGSEIPVIQSVQPSYVSEDIISQWQHYLSWKLKTGYRGAYSKLPCVYWLSPASLIFFGPNTLSESVASAATKNNYLK